MNRTILIAEDNEDDLFLLQTALRRAGIGNPLQIARDGQEAIDYLAQKGKFLDRTQHPFPSVIITDIRMPRCSGLDVIRWVKKHPQFSSVPVIVLSNSAEPRDVREAYALGISAFFQKPLTIEEMTRKLRHYWSLAVAPELAKAC